MERRTKMAIGAAAAAAAVAGAVLAAKKMKEKGYDKKAVTMLKGWSRKLKTEAARMQKKATNTATKKSTSRPARARSHKSSKKQ